MDLVTCVCLCGDAFDLVMMSLMTSVFVGWLVLVCLCSDSSDARLYSDDRLVGLVVKASAWRAEGPEFESLLRRDFFGVESYQ